MSDLNNALSELASVLHALQLGRSIGISVTVANALSPKTETFFYLYDGLGSIVGLTDKKGKVVEKFEYDSFGNLKNKGHGKVKQPYAYTGREFDRETGLYYYRARYYDPQVGRFINRDVFAGFPDLPQTINKYPYVTNNPLNLTDADGTFPLAAVAIGAAVGGSINGISEALSYIALTNATGDDIDILEAIKIFGKGFLSGAVAGGLGIGLSAFGVGAIISGSAASLFGSLTTDLLDWQMPDPIETVTITAFGGVSGGLLNKFSSLRPIGGVSKYPQNWSSGFGENSLRLTIRQVFSTAPSSFFRTAFTSFINLSMPIPGLK